MAINLTDNELRELQRKPTGIRCEDQTTHKVYLVLDEHVGRQAIDALRQQKQFEDLQISVGQADAGDTMPLEEADAQLRAEFGLPPRP